MSGHRQRQGPEIATPGGPLVEVFTTLAISWSPEPGRYIQIVLVRYAAALGLGAGRGH